MNESLGAVVTTWLNNPELQTAILLGLTCIGAWVVLTWILCFVFTIIWPLIFITSVIVICPNMARTVVNYVVPKYGEMIAMVCRMFHPQNFTHAGELLQGDHLHRQSNLQPIYRRH